MEIWEWTSQQLTCKLDFENSFLDIWKWLWQLQTEFRKSKLLYGHVGMDLSTVNVQAEFRKSKLLYGDLGKGLLTVNLHRSVHPANHIRCSSNTAITEHFPSKTFSFKHHLTGEAWPGMDLSTVNLQPEFRKFLLDMWKRL